MTITVIDPRVPPIANSQRQPTDYSYDANGDLVTFTDRENKTTTFTYNSDHHLMTIVDARGINILTNQYDAGGRLIGQTDAHSKKTLSILGVLRRAIINVECDER